MDGGTDGGDGECDTSEPETCGKGMGIDIRQLSTDYALTPGPGGGTNALWSTMCGYHKKNFSSRIWAILYSFLPRNAT